MCKRIGIYATYDKQGIIDDYIVFCLEQLHTVVDYLVVVSNHELSDEMQKRIEIADKIFIRNDIGFDAGAISDVFCSFMGWESIYEYDEVVIMNDSVFGPFWSLRDIFKKMDKNSQLDFWGIAKRGKSDFDGGEVVYPEHIQLYLYVIRKRMLHSEVFKTFWEKIPEKLQTFRSAIVHYEFEFTKYFEDAGFRWDIYAPMEKFDTERVEFNLSPYHYDNLSMISSKGCPVLKRKVFTADFIEMKYSDRADLTRTVKYIKNNTDYDIGLMWKHILRVYSMHEIIDGMHLYTVLPHRSDKFASETSPRNVSVINLGAWFPPQLKGKIKIENEINACAEFVLLLKVNRNKEYPASVEDAEQYCVYENLIVDMNYMGEIVRHFESNPYSGMLVPPLQTFGNISESVSGTWEDKERAFELYKIFELGVPFHSVKSPIHKIQACWIRKSILDDRILGELSKDDTGTMWQILSLITQEKGYYTEILQSDIYSAHEFANMRKLLQDVLKAVNVPTKSNYSQILDAIRENPIKNFCRQFEHIYIYGAGQLACRAAKCVEKYSRFEGFLVTSLLDNADSLIGHRVEAIDDISLNFNIGVVVAVGERHNDDVIKKLQEKGIKEYIFFS